MSETVRPKVDLDKLLQVLCQVFIAALRRHSVPPAQVRTLPPRVIAQLIATTYQGATADALAREFSIIDPAVLEVLVLHLQDHGLLIETLATYLGVFRYVATPPGRELVGYRAEVKIELRYVDGSYAVPPLIVNTEGPPGGIAVGQFLVHIQSHLLQAVELLVKDGFDRVEEKFPRREPPTPGEN